MCLLSITVAINSYYYTYYIYNYIFIIELAHHLKYIGTNYMYIIYLLLYIFVNFIHLFSDYSVH